MVAAQTNTENLYFWHIDKKNIKNSSKIITNSGIISAFCYFALPDVAHGSNSNIGSSLSIAAAAVAAAAAAPVGFNLDSPEDMDFEAMREKRSRTQAADDEVQDHKVVVTNYESDYENL